MSGESESESSASSDGSEKPCCNGCRCGHGRTEGHESSDCASMYLERCCLHACCLLLYYSP
eukprot:12651418-Alexandrium_andersonii.AAC.1